ncbi:hypothetical protein [Gallaecimonas mangrovi]|uniref:hypothetical protein n=1 Tax=Gallaecimonas mangrovi TaxID=2291597 RepID=UPI000E202884|nr:hypothetical protein [Gallaecimonas mangrovi]
MSDYEAPTEEELGDWRIAAVTWLTKDVPATSGGAPAHKAGSVVTQAASVKLKNGANLGFTLPSATALALDMAAQSAESSMKLLRQFTWQDVITPDGPGFSVAKEDTTELFNFFQQCMITSTFSFQALEVFCNQSIGRSVKDAVTVKRRNKRVSMSASELERQLSTSEKLSQILPPLYEVATPKGKKVWEPFKKLQEARDSSIHFKSSHQYAVSEDTLYYDFLNGNFQHFPRAAADMISWFYKDNQPRWLKIWYEKYA